MIEIFLESPGILVGTHTTVINHSTYEAFRCGGFVNPVMPTLTDALI